MYEGRIVFTQLMDFLPRHTFRRRVKSYGGDRRVRTFTCWEQFLAMAFAQLTYRESLRDIEACLGAAPEKLYHMGFRAKVSRSTLADANETRDWRIYADFAQTLITVARRLYADEPLAAELERTVYALDSTTIDLCLSLFPWARLRQTRGAVKMHTLLDLAGNIPAFAWITEGKTHDVKILDRLLAEPGSIDVPDRGYIDFARLHRLGEQRATFVVRAKKNLKCRRLYSRASTARPDSSATRRAGEPVEVCRGVPGRAPACASEGPRDGQERGRAHQRLHAASPHGGRALPRALADRALLQVDQAASQDQALLWHLGQRGPDPALDRHLGLRARGHRPQATRDRA